MHSQLYEKWCYLLRPSLSRDWPRETIARPLSNIQDEVGATRDYAYTEPHRLTIYLWRYYIHSGRAGLQRDFPFHIINRAVASTDVSMVSRYVAVALQRCCNSSQLHHQVPLIDIIPQRKYCTSRSIASHRAIPIHIL